MNYVRIRKGLYSLTGLSREEGNIFYKDSSGSEFFHFLLRTSK